MVLETVLRRKGGKRRKRAIGSLGGDSCRFFRWARPPKNKKSWPPPSIQSTALRLAGVLRGTRRTWSSSEIVRSENTGMLTGSNRRPDILVLEANVSPVVIETEVIPAITVEDEAKSRLGEQVRTSGRTILSSVAVRLPVRLRTKTGAALKTELVTANDLEMALYTGSAPANASRWPRSGWILASAADLSILTQSASVPPDIIEAAADHLEPVREHIESSESFVIQGRRPDSLGGSPMWTSKNRRRYDRSRLRYPSDLTDEEWACLWSRSCCAEAKLLAAIGVMWSVARSRQRPDVYPEHRLSCGGRSR